MNDFSSLAIYKHLQGKPTLKTDLFVATDNQFKLIHVTIEY